MTVNELRINNWLHYEENNLIKPELQNKDFQVIPDDIVYLSENPKIDWLITAIPLNNEWLLKFGAKIDESNDYYLLLPDLIDMRLYIKHDHILLCKGQVCPLFEYDHIKSIHQLQNLYFTLTGKELEVK
jgi:hypothetical protein